jgi:hypothetical protein
MKYELKIVHDRLISLKLDEWTKENRIGGYTTLLVHQSFGAHHGRFNLDNLSGEKYLSLLYFEENQEKLARKIKAEMQAEDFFVVLSELL